MLIDVLEEVEDVDKLVEELVELVLVELLVLDVDMLVEEDVLEVEVLLEVEVELVEVD